MWQTENRKAATVSGIHIFLHYLMMVFNCRSYTD